MFYTSFADVLENYPYRAKFTVPEEHHPFLDMLAPYTTATFLLQWIQTDSVGEAEHIINDYVQELPEEVSDRLRHVTGTEWVKILDNMIFVYMAVVHSAPDSKKRRSEQGE